MQFTCNSKLIYRPLDFRHPLLDCQLSNVGDEVLFFYNDLQSYQTLSELMQSDGDKLDPASPLTYHINLVKLLSGCTEGKNLNTEIKCQSLLPLEDIVRIVTLPDCIPEVGALCLNWKIYLAAYIKITCFT